MQRGNWGRGPLIDGADGSQRAPESYSIRIQEDGPKFDGWPLNLIIACSAHRAAVVYHLSGHITDGFARSATITWMVASVAGFLAGAYWAG